MQFQTIEREIHIDASPEVVFDVVSSPEPSAGVVAGRRAVRTGRPGDRARSSSVTARGWDSRYSSPLSTRYRRGRSRSAGRTRRTSLRPSGNSLLVIFELAPAGDGTLLRMTESGFRERGWDAAVLEHQYEEHVTGWDFYLRPAEAVRGDLLVRR